MFTENERLCASVGMVIVVCLETDEKINFDHMLK